MRIDVISEMPAAWRLTVRRWSRLNRSHRRTVDGRPAPTRNDEYLLYQLLVGSLPPGPLADDALAAYRQRIVQTMLKSVREAKTVTSWMNPNEAYETALAAFVEALLGRRDSNLFLDDLQTQAAVFAWHGALNGLTLALVKTLSPGVPDFYQGHETIELSLVDPDNRRAVDFARRRAMLAEARAIAARPDRSAALRELLTQAVDGRAKFWVTWRALQLRRRHEGMLGRAAYVPLELRGVRERHAVAFARREGRHWLVVVGVRLSASPDLGAGQAEAVLDWEDTAIVWPDADAAHLVPAAPWLEDAISGRRHALRGGLLPLAEVLREFPVAALYGDDGGSDDEPRGAGAGAD